MGASSTVSTFGGTRSRRRGRPATPERHATMKRFLSSAAAAGLLLTATAVVAPSASADERTCRGTLRAVTVDDVKVPRGATCRMYGTRVKGNIKVQSGAKFTAAHQRRRQHPVPGPPVGQGRGLARRRQHPARAGSGSDAQPQHRRRRHPGLQQPLRLQEHLLQPRRRQPPVQEQQPGPQGRPQHRQGQQGGPVPSPLIPDTMS